MPPEKQGTRNSTSVFSAIDLVPSLLKITNTPTPDGVEFDGEDLSDTLLGRSTASRTAPLFFRRPPDRKEFRHYKNLPDLAVRSGKWKLYSDYDGESPELYDLEADPSETKNVIAGNRALAKELTASLVSWHESLPQDNGPSLGQTQ